MIAEVERGRMPFWGHLLLMVSILDEHRAAYEAGADLSGLVEPIYAEVGLLRFLPAASPQAQIRLLREERDEFRHLFAEEPWPLGVPRVAGVADRGELQAFAIDEAWLNEHAD